jgi:hypothetical protein
MNNKNQIAPVFISVFDRFSHFKKCIESLQKNKEAELTTLYISSDGPTNQDSLERIDLIREYLKYLKGFKKVNLFLAKENTGGEILIKTSNAIRGDCKQYIYSEDDNIFSPYFLSYMNEGLNIYREHKDIYAVCGYMYPGYRAERNEQIFLKCLAAWGIGYWTDKDIPNSFDEAIFANEIFDDEHFFRKINQSLPVMGPMLRLIADRKLKAGDVTRSALLFKRRQVCIFPPVSLVRNIGHDGSGKHCGENRKYAQQPIFLEKVIFNPFKTCKPTMGDKFWLFQYFGGCIASWRGEFILKERESLGGIAKITYRYMQACLAIMLRIRNIARRFRRLPFYD